jgi:hypothetical protein
LTSWLTDRIKVSDLTSIEYFTSGKWMYALTFVFNHIKSPPDGTYDQTTEESEEVDGS